MPTLTTMVRAGVAIRGDVTWPSVYTQPAWLLEMSLPGNSIAAGRLPGTRKVGLIPGGSTRMTSASSTIPRMAAVNLSRLRWLPWLP